MNTRRTYSYSIPWNQWSLTRDNIAITVNRKDRNGKISRDEMRGNYEEILITHKKSVTHKKILSLTSNNRQIRHQNITTKGLIAVPIPPTLSYDKSEEVFPPNIR